MLLGSVASDIVTYSYCPVPSNQMKCHVLPIRSFNIAVTFYCLLEANKPFVLPYLYNAL